MTAKECSEFLHIIFLYNTHEELTDELLKKKYTKQDLIVLLVSIVTLMKEEGYRIGNK
jgi:hypothetical protein